MKRLKSHRKNLSIDMAAMCDVAFLILVFFVLTARAEQRLPMRVDLPLASKREDIPPDNIADVMIGHGKVAFEIPGSKTREQTLIQMGDKYRVKFSPSEISKFGKIDVIAIPFSELKHYIDGYYKEEAFFSQPGIPFTSNNFELANWIYESRKAEKTLNDRNLQFEIYADERTIYPQIEKAMNIFQNQNIYKIGLVTDLKTYQNESGYH